MPHHRIPGLLCAVLICCTFASWAKRLPVEVYGNLPHTDMVHLSPDGTKVAYLSNNGDKQQIVVFDRHTKKTIGGLDVSNVRPHDLEFINNEQLIIRSYQYILKDLGRYTRKLRMSTAYRFNLETKEIAQLLIPGRGIYENQTGLGSVTGLSQDQKYLYMEAYVPHKGDDAGPPTFNLLKVNLHSKKPLPRTFIKGTPFTTDYFMSPQEQVLARERFNDRQNLHRIEAKHDGNWVEIYREETPYLTKHAVGLTPDLQALVLKAVADNGMWSYYRMSLKDGAITGPIFGQDNKEVEHVITDFNRVVSGVRYAGFTPSYEFFDRKVTAKVKAVQQAFGTDSVTLVDRSDDWKTLLFKVEGEGIPGDYFIFEKGELSFLTGSVDDVLVEHTNLVKEYQYQARDGLTIPTLLTYPKDKPSKTLPAIMLPHGGPEHHDKKDFYWLAQYFANRGYLVIQPQFRGSDGFGADHTLAGYGEWGKKMQSDLTDAVKALTKEGKVDPERVCIVGASYGGYAALAGATMTPELYRCAISINGLSDLEQFISEREKWYGSNSSVIAYWQDIMANGKVSNDYLENISPINFVQKVQAPVLLIHGSQDDVVPMDQSEDMYDELKGEKKEVIFVELEGDDHYLSKGKTRLQALKAIDQFIQKHLG